MPLQDEVPLINGKAYSWCHIKFIMAGAPEVGVAKISYSDNQKKENGKAAGAMPIDRGDGEYEAECSITLRAASVEAITAKSPGRRIQDFGVFDIVVCFLVGTTKTTHKIRNVEFTGNKRDMSSGDTIINCDMGLICSHIEW